jgi:tRNA-specific 2-thiouridylase
MGKRVMVAMSGGVDSSLAAALLKEQGYEVVGVTLRLFPEVEGYPHPCCLVEDAVDACGVCGLLGVPHYVLNYERPFQEKVVGYFLEEYRLGRTPNPCLACNREIKFRLLLRRALALGMDLLATGHYARIIHNGHYRLLRGSDPQKDQSYFLYSLGQEELAHLLMPVGDLRKGRVRATARALGLPTAEKPESRDICFVPNGLASFLARHIKSEPGEMVDREGRVLASHPGVAFFTVGQRHGLGLSSSRPLYVLRIETETNRLVVGPEEELYSRELVAGRLSWVAGLPPEAAEAEACIRYRSPAVPAVLEVSGDRTRVLFSRPQRAICPGQAVVFYCGEEVLGGGVIEA